MIVRDEGGLSAITDAIHDWWMDIDALEWRREMACVSFPIGRRKNRLTGRLVVHAVLDVLCIDREGVGLYDITLIRYLPGERMIEIKTGIPLELRLRVTAIDIEVV